jgi:hypothetical protein
MDGGACLGSLCIWIQIALIRDTVTEEATTAAQVVWRDRGCIVSDLRLGRW